MEPLDEIIIKSFLRADAQGKVQKEDDKLEYKEVFDNGNKEAKAKYAKEMAALHNYQGGYLIFGVNDAQELVGLHGFSEPDNAKLVDDINTYFSPTIRFQSKSFAIDDKIVFVIYVEKRASIPTVCIRDHDKILSDGTIYWRYSAKSAPIKSGDLIHLLQSLRGEDNAKLAEIAEKEFRSRSKPHFTQSTVSTGGGTFDFTLSLRNFGELCYVTGLRFVEGDMLYLHNLNRPQLVQANGSFSIEGRTNQKHLKESNAKIELEIKDKENHRYKQLIELKGTKMVLHDLEAL